MAGGFKRKSAYKSDDFVASDDDTSHPSKKSKPEASKFQPSTTAKTDTDGNKFWEISGLRRVTVSEFKGKSMVSIREYYQKDGQDLPGKKGISMTVEQYSALIGLMPQIEQQLKSRGEKIPRPRYTGDAAKADEEDDQEDEEPEKTNGDDEEEDEDEDE